LIRDFWSSPSIRGIRLEMATDMTLILSNEDVEKLLTMPECIEVLEEAYVELAEGRGVSRTRSDCITPTSRPDAVYALKSMDGVIPKLGIGAIRINSDIVTFPKRGNNIRREKVPAAPNGRYCGLVLLFSTENGEPLAILPDGVMQRMRVGAANGLGVKYLARKDARTVGILGSGWHREAFSKQMSAVLGVEVIPVDQTETAIEGADIVMCATNTLDNVFFERWIRPGIHLSSIKRPEIESKALARADRIVLHSHDASPIHVTTRDLAGAEKGKERGWSTAAELDFQKLPTLPELIAGKVAGRRSAEEVTCFMNNIGLGYQFAAAGAVVYRKAKESGIGHELPTDWFTEDVHP
jgi:alanine dehydrogenase